VWLGVAARGQGASSDCGGEAELAPQIEAAHGAIREVALMAAA
jgi:hypothetical protein